MNPLVASGKPLFFKLRAPLPGLVPLSEVPGAAIRTVARSLSVMQKEALIGSSATGVVWRLSSDEGKYLMGDDVAPCPLAFMTTGMVASFAEHVHGLARERGIELPGFRLVQDNYYTMEGSALRGTMKGGALPIDVSIEVDSVRPEVPSSLLPEVLSSLLEEAVARSPVSALVRTALNNRFSLTHNGHSVAPGRATALEGAPEPSRLEEFEVAQPVEGVWDGLVRRNGMSPKTSEVTSSTGSSYAEEQNRRLHLRAICTIREDGIKVIEQQLLNPHGSIFYLLSEEPGGNPNALRAPDALSYVSAGIAFCFLTQFGRYAKIVRKNLEAYSVVQDIRFGVEGDRPRAEPVETHVHLTSGEDDVFARQILDMSEQTCFLHALCRDKLTVKTSIAAATR